MKLIKSAHVLTLGMLSLLPLASFVCLAPQVHAESKVEFSQGQLDQMLAPIALYPDALLSQVLIASTYPIEIVQADRWARTHSNLKGADAVGVVSDKDWDPAVKALVAFPDILQRMSDDVDWTQRLGDAFLSDESAVMDSVQRLRKRAYANGNLEKAEHIKVAREESTIVIEPAEERVVYVPVYDTRVVYGTWWWADYPPVYWHYPSSYTYVSGFYWGPSIYIGPSYYYSSCHWRDRRVVVIDRDRHYGDHYFYTGRSIVTYEGARAWRHDPIHRRGVAYYNNNLRENYGSFHQSRREDHDYRERFRSNEPQRSNEQREANREPREENRSFHRMTDNSVTEGHYRDDNSRQSIDRADQVRARLSGQEQNDERSREQRPAFNPGLARSGDQRDSRNTIETRHETNQQPNTPGERIDRSFVRDIPRTEPTRPNNVMTEETARREMYTRQRENSNVSQTENRVQERVQTIERPQEPVRATRIDDSMTRRVESGRDIPRAEHENRGGGARVLRGRGDDDKKE